jgi:hypothetical protein
MNPELILQLAKELDDYSLDKEAAIEDTVYNLVDQGKIDEADKFAVIDAVKELI